MKLRRPDPRRVATTICVIVTISAAAVIWQHLPTPTDVLGPFDVHGDAGTSTTGRAISATVTGARVSPKVSSVKPAGMWVVVDAAVEGTRSTELPHSELIVGPNTYTPTDMFFTDTLRAEVSPGLTLRGSWVFDFAPALVAPGASHPMTLRLWVGDGRLDSRLVIGIPTADLSRVETVTLEEPKQSVS